MWQHVDGHATGQTHDLVDLFWSENEIIPVTSTHHQMMVPGKQGEVLGIAFEAKRFESANPKRDKPEYDTEVVYYDTTWSLCFQPHPEYVKKNDPCRRYFFELLEYLM